ncbi:MAG: lipopolysaccharide kinase InaA family protein [Victivallales bacterium]|nr:lipopolysaccharide kinase InaA family protein [Victivallales bacterium]
MSRKIDNSENHCSPGDSDFHFFKNSCLQGMVSGKLPDAALAGLQELDLLLANSKLAKDTRSTTAGAVELGDRKYFLKRYNNKTFKRKLKNSIRQTRPFRVLKTSLCITAAGIFTPEVFAALNYRRGLLLESAYLLTGYLETATTAPQMLEDFTEKSNLDKFTDVSCRMLAQIHKAGILHGDAKISNILIIPDSGNSYQLGLFDLDGSHCYSGALPVRRRIRDLARLISSLSASCRDRGLKIMPLSELTAGFAAKYREVSGLNLASNRLTDRTEYLSARVRKK